MITTYLYGLGSVIIVSCISLLGVFILSLKETMLRKYIYLFISLAAGALMGDAFIHLIPEAFEGFEQPVAVSLLIIGGIGGFFILEKFLHWHHHGEPGHKHENHTHPVGALVLVSDSIHNLIDGVIIGVSFMVAVPVGIATTIAVILHEIPQEIGDFTVLLHAGYKRSRALWLNFISAFMAVAGVLVAFILGETGDGLAIWILPVAAGGFVYIAMADLIPELHKTKNASHSAVQIMGVVVGVATMYVLVFLK